MNCNRTAPRHVWKTTDDMNLPALQQKLLAAARRHPPGDAVPHAFERRILALLRGKPAADPCLWWVRGLWRATAPCVALSLLLVGWTLIGTPNAGPTEEFAQELENTVFAAVDQTGDSTW